MEEEISRLLKNGSEAIVRAWTEKVISDKRVQSDAQLSYMQLIDHVPQIVEELQHALASGSLLTEMPVKGTAHGRVRWQQGYELKEVIRELMLLRATLMEFIDTYRGALRSQTVDDLSRSYRHITVFMDEELYKTVEAYLDAPREPPPVENIAA